MRKWLIELAVGLALCALATLVFRAFPALDFATSGLFYAGEGGRFWLWQNETLGLVRSIGETIPWVVFGAVGSALVLKLLRPLRPMPIRPKAALFLVLTLALGPGLIANQLKDNWGRPRPWMDQEVGGPLTYEKPWTISDQCPKNCSFVSGEGATGFWLIALLPFVPRPYRGRALAGILLAGILIGGARIAVGGHFLSDVVFAGFVTYGVVWLVYLVLYRLRPAALEDDVLEAELERIGLGLRRLCATLARR